MTDPTEQQPVDPMSRQQGPSPQEFARMQQQYNMNKLKNKIIAVLGNPDGIELIEMLMTNYVHKPTWVPGAPEGFGFKREGENSLILSFKHIVEHARLGSVAA